MSVNSGRPFTLDHSFERCQPNGDEREEEKRSEPVQLSETELGSLVGELSRELLQTVDEGSAPELLDLLSRIVSTDGDTLRGATRDRERLELLQSIAMRLRLDLHSMLAQIYQRLEAARAYVGVVRHLAGEPDGFMRQDAVGAGHCDAGTAYRKPAPLLLWPCSPREAECQESARIAEPAISLPVVRGGGREN